MVTIITDSSSEFSKDFQKKYNVKVTPMPINFGETTYLSGEDISNEDFYKKLKAADKLPTTSMVNSYTFKDIFEKEIKKGNEVIAIVISSHLSVTYEQAVLAAKEVDKDRIFVMDSQSASLGQSAIVIEAVKLRDKGHTAREIYDILKEQSKKVRVVAMVDTLKYLKAGGRLSSAAAVIGTMLHIKPLITVEAGKVVVQGKAIGKANAFKKIITQLNTANIDTSKCVILAHACDLKVKEELTELINKKTNIKITDIVQIGATIGVHVGPGAVGISYYEK